VVTILIATLKALTEVVLVLASLDVALVAVAARSIRVRTAPVQTDATIPVSTTSRESLSVTFTYRLPQKLSSAVVSVVPTAVPIDAVTIIAGLQRFEP